MFTSSLVSRRPFAFRTCLKLSKPILQVGSMRPSSSEKSLHGNRVMERSRLAIRRRRLFEATFKIKNFIIEQKRFRMNSSRFWKPTASNTTQNLFLRMSTTVDGDAIAIAPSGALVFGSLLIPRLTPWANRYRHSVAGGGLPIKIQPKIFCLRMSTTVDRDASLSPHPGLLVFGLLLIPRLTPWANF